MPKKNNTLLIVAISLFAVAVGVLIGTFFFLHYEDESLHRPVPLLLSIEAADYDPQTASGLPVAIEGTDLDGKRVSELRLFDQDSTTFELLQGEYVITVVGSPVNAQGVVYEIPTTPIDLSIQENRIYINGVENGSVQEDMPSIQLPTIMLSPIKSETITNDQIDAVRAWMSRFGLSESRINEFVQAINTNKQAALDRIAAEKLEAWRTKLTGEFCGIGQNSSSADYITLTVDGDKLIVRGGLSRTSGSGGAAGRLSGNEWHFLLTSKTTYGYYAENRFYQTKSEFFSDFLPDRYPGLLIKVQDGYVVDMYASP